MKTLSNFMEFGAVLAWECKEPVLIFVTTLPSCLINLDWTIPSACIRVNVMYSRKVMCRLEYYIGLMVLVLKLIFFFCIASFPIYVEKFLRSKLQNRFTDIVVTQSWCLQFTKSTCWRYGRVTLWNITSLQCLTCFFSSET